MSVVNEIEAIAESVFEKQFAMIRQRGYETIHVPPDALAIRNKLVCINAKQHISISEAALLLNCSDGHVRNLIRKTRMRQSKRPIPFVDLDGVTVFNRIALLDWANGSASTREE